MMVLGIVIAGAGVIALGFGVRINEFSVGHTLIMSGTFALAGGLVMVGLSAVIAKLARITKLLEAQPAAHLAVATAGKSPPFEPAEFSVPADHLDTSSTAPVVVPPAQAQAVASQPEADTRTAEAKPEAADVSASAIERLRSSLARPANVAAAPTKTDFAPKPPVLAEADNLLPSAPAGQNGASYEPETDVDARNSPAEALKKKHLDFLFRNRAKGATAEQSEPQWPRRGSNGGHAVAGRALPPVAAAPDHESSPAPDIIKSGVVDGMAYTLYADGSIEAQLPHGIVRFGSITELRAHIENNT